MLAHKRSNRRSSRRRGSSRAGKPPEYMGPPPIIPTKPFMIKFRYQFLATQLDTVSGSVLLSQMVMATSATASFRLFAAVRLRSVEIWAAGSLGSTGSSIPQNQVAVEWFGTTNSYQTSVKVSDVTMGVTPAHVKTKPPKNSTPDFWITQGGQSDTTTTLFSINGSIGAVVDVVLQCVLVDDEAANAGPTTTGMTAGTVYYNYLDGRSSGNIQPFSGVRALT